jgi:hypothetical protein
LLLFQSARIHLPSLKIWSKKLIFFVVWKLTLIVKSLTMSIAPLERISSCYILVGSCGCSISRRIEAFIFSDSPSLRAQNCGLRLLFRHNEGEFMEVVRHCVALLSDSWDLICLAVDLRRRYKQIHDDDDQTRAKEFCLNKL